jgi:hypothetical protein
MYISKETVAMHVSPRRIVRPSSLHFIVWAAVCLMFINVGRAQECLDYRDYDQPRVYLPLGFGACTDLTLDGDYAYLIQEDVGLHIVDISAPQTPQLIATVPITEPLDVEICAGAAYVLSGDRGLIQLDIQDPYNVQEVATYANYLGAQHLAAREDYLYVSLLYQIYVLDLRSTEELIIAATIPVQSNTRIKIQEHYLYTMKYDCRRYDITNPNFPILDTGPSVSPDKIGDDPPPYEYIAIAARGDYLITAGGREGDLYSYPYYIIDWDITAVTGGDDPQNFGSLTTNQYRDLVLVDDYLLTSEGLVMDISGGEFPVLFTELYLDVYAEEFRLQGGWIFMAGEFGGFGGLQILHKDDIAHRMPPIAGEFPFKAYDKQSVGDLLYTTTRDGLEILDMSDISAPEHVGIMPLPLGFTHIHVDGSRVFLDHSSDGDFFSVNLDDPLTPVLMDYITYDGWDIRFFEVSGDYAYLFIADDIHVIDVSDLSNIFEISVFSLDSRPLAAATYGDQLYVTYVYEDAMSVIDISDPLNMQIISTVPQGASYYGDILIHEGFMLVGKSKNFAVYSLDDPQAPELLSLLPMEQDVGAIAALGRFAYIVYRWDWHGAMPIIDFTNPRAAKRVAPLRLGKYLNNLFVINDMVCGYTGVNGYYSVFNSTYTAKIAYKQCSDNVPVFLSSFDLLYEAGSVSARWRVDENGYRPEFRLVGDRDGLDWDVPYVKTESGLYVAEDPLSAVLHTGDVEYSLYIKDGEQWLLLASDTVALDLPRASARLYDAYPNPFNPQTAIVFDLPRPAELNLKIYDMSGRLVRVLVNGTMTQAGRRQVLWNGRDDSGREVSSGSYFVRMTCDGANDVRKVMLVR